MMIHKHLLISVISAFLISLIFFPPNSLIQLMIWVALAGFFSVLLDADSTLIIFLSKSRKLAPYKNFSYLNSHFSQFLRAFSETGLLKIAMATHLIFSTIYLLTAYSLAGIYFTPIAIGVLSHLITDIPNLNYL